MHVCACIYVCMYAHVYTHVYIFMYACNVRDVFMYVRVCMQSVNICCKYLYRKKRTHRSHPPLLSLSFSPLLNHNMRLYLARYSTSTRMGLKTCTSSGCSCFSRLLPTGAPTNRHRMSFLSSSCIGSRLCCRPSTGYMMY